MKQKFYAFKSWFMLLLLCLGVGTAMAQTTVTQETFTAVSGNVQDDPNVSFESFQGGAATPPTAEYANQIRLYQKSSSAEYGGFITLSVPAGYVITSATVGTAMNTTVATAIDGGELSAGEALAKGAKLEKTGLNASSVSFYCLGTNKSTRLYVNYLSVTYQPTGGVVVEAPTLTTEGNVYEGKWFVDPLKVKVSGPEGASLFYSVDGTEPTAAYPEAGIEISETTTLKVVAEKDGTKSSVVTEEYVKATKLEGLGALRNYTETTEKFFYCTVNKALVTDANLNPYMQDETGAIMVYVLNSGLAKGDELTGVITGMCKDYNGTKEITKIDFSACTKETGKPVTAEVVTYDELSVDVEMYRDKRLRIENLTVVNAFGSGRQATVTDGTTEFVLYKQDKNDATEITEGVKYHVEGYVSVYNGNVQLNVTGADAFELATTKTLTELTVEQAELTLNVNTTGQIACTTNTTATLTYASSDEGVVKVSETGELTAVAVGQAVITISAPENDEYTAASTEVTVNVVDPNALPSGNALVAVSKDGISYAMTYSPNANNNKLLATPVKTVNGKVIATRGVAVDYAWEVDATAGTLKCAAGYVSVPSTTKTNIELSETPFTWTVNEEGNWTSGERFLAINTEVDPVVFGNYASSYPKASMMTFAEGATQTFADTNYGTYCAAWNVAAGDFSGCKFFTVVGKRVENGKLTAIVLQEAATLEAGKPYIVQAEAADAEGVMAYTGDRVDEITSANGLIPTTGTEEELNGKYIIENNQLKLVDAAVEQWEGYKATIDVATLPEVDAETQGVDVPFAGTLTGIASVEAAANAGVVNVYTLAGVPVRVGVAADKAVQGLKKGIYLVGDQKVIVK